MPIRCVAGGCSNTYKDGVSFFKFPIVITINIDSKEHYIITELTVTEL